MKKWGGIKEGRKGGKEGRVTRYSIGIVDERGEEKRALARTGTSSNIIHFTRSKQINGQLQNGV